MKLCHKCKEEKQEAEFFKNRVRKDGLANYCKTCMSAYRKARTGTGKFSSSREQVDHLIAKVKEEYTEGTSDACYRIAEELGMNYKTVRWGSGLIWPAYRLAMILLLDEDPGRTDDKN